MTTFAEILAFVKAAARIPTNDTSRDTQIGMSINWARRQVIGEDFMPAMRVPMTQVLTAGTQNYAMPADFNVIAVESLLVYTTGTTDYTNIPLVTGADAELWEGMQSDYAPNAARIVAGASIGLRNLRLLPAFTATNLTLAYAYYKHPADAAGSDVIGSPNLCDAIACGCLMDDKDWNRDRGDNGIQNDYANKYKMAKRRFRSEFLN